METALSQIQRNVLYSIKQTNANIAKAQLALASGKDVQSVLDSPQNFFESRALVNQANDLDRYLDGISTSIRTIQETNIGVETMIKIIDQAEALIKEGLIELFPAPDEVPDPEALQERQRMAFIQTGHRGNQTNSLAPLIQKTLRICAQMAFGMIYQKAGI